MIGNKIVEDISKKKLIAAGYVVVKSDDLEGIKSQSPGLYAKIYQQGKEDGRAQAREHTKIIARSKTREDEAKKLVEEKRLTNKKDFKTLMNEYQAEHKCTKLEALKACVKLYPDKFKAGRG